MQLIVSLYVDDLLVLGNESDSLNQIKKIWKNNLKYLVRINVSCERYVTYVRTNK